MSTRLSLVATLLVAALLPTVCFADSLDRYRENMPAPLPAPTLDDIAAAHAAAAQRAHDHPPAPLTAPLAWLSRPGARDFEAAYPRDAFRDGLGGDVTLECLVQVDGELACVVANETPPGMGFGEAARLAAARFRLPQQTADGRPTAGGTVTIPLHFRVTNR
jgi:TonB family protein